MTWFKVDDRFYSHAKVLSTPPEALGLWVVAGSWSAANLTDGLVPDHVLERLLPDSARLAGKLVTAGLWRRVRAGYQFHDWTQWNPTAKEVRELQAKRAEAGRKGGLTSARTRSNSRARASPTAEPSAGAPLQPPTRPFPSSKERRGGSGGASAPPASAAPPPNTTDAPRCDLCGNRVNEAYHRNSCARTAQIGAA